MSKLNKNKSLWSIGLVIVLFLGIIGVTNYGRAQLEKSGVAELTELAQSLNNADAFMAGINYLLGDSGEDILGGASRFPQSHIYAGDGFYADNADGFNWGTYSVSGGNPVLADGLSERLVVITASATSSAAVVNPESETIYVFDAWARIQTATGTVQELTLGTSTVAYVAPQGSCGADDTCANATAKDASILQTGDITASTAANTTYFKADYQGTDTRDGSGSRYLVPVNSGEYFTCSASTTLDIAYGAGAFQCGFKYYVVED